jgi:hypothetical protein
MEGSFPEAAFVYGTTAVVNYQLGGALGTGLIPPLTILQFKPDRLSSGLKHLLANEVFEIKAGYVQPPAVKSIASTVKGAVPVAAAK